MVPVSRDSNRHFMTPFLSHFFFLFYFAGWQRSQVYVTASDKMSRKKKLFSNVFKEWMEDIFGTSFSGFFAVKNYFNVRI